MSTTRESQTHTLSLSRVFDAPIRFLFDCFTDPALVMKWWGPQGTHCPEATSDLQIGGNYRFVIEDPGSGDQFISCGRYLLIEPPNRLVFSWYWEADPEEVTRVSIGFRAVDDAHTELTLVHDRFPSQDTAESHEGGWTSSLERLAGLLSRSR